MSAPSATAAAGLPPAEAMHFEVAKDLRTIHADMRVMRMELSRVPMEMTVMKTSILECNHRMDALEAHLAHPRVELLEMMNVTAQQQATIQRLAAELELKEQSDLLAFELDVVGVPETKNENPREIVSAIVRKLGVTLEPRDIVRAERSMDPFYPLSKPRTIAVRFSTTYVRSEVLRAARKNSKETTTSVGLPGACRRIHVHERLSKEKRMLFNRAHLAGRQMGWKYIWTGSGRIFARKETHMPKFIIENEMDLMAVFQSNGGHPAN